MIVTWATPQNWINQINKPALLFLFGVKFPVLSGYLNFPWTVGFQTVVVFFLIFQNQRTVGSLREKYINIRILRSIRIQKCIHNLWILDLLLPFGCEKFPCVVYGYLNFQRTVNFSFFKSISESKNRYSQLFQKPRRTCGSHERTGKEPVVFLNWLCDFLSIFENRGYTPTPGLWFLRPAVVTPNNLPDNRRGGLFLPLITTCRRKFCTNVKNKNIVACFTAFQLRFWFGSIFFKAVFYFLDIRCALQIPW
jgi:hypothetical protein